MYGRGWLFVSDETMHLTFDHSDLFKVLTLTARTTEIHPNCEQTETFCNNALAKPNVLGEKVFKYFKKSPVRSVFMKGPFKEMT